MKKKWRTNRLIAGLGLLVFVLCCARTTYPQTAAPSPTSPVRDSDTLRALEITLIRLKAAEERNKLLEDRLEAKDSIIAAKDGVISVRDEQLKLALEANKERAAVNTGDARMLQSCENQLAKADAEIHRLRHPGFFRSLFDPKSITGAAVGFGIGRATK